MYTYGRFTLFYGRSQHDIIKNYPPIKNKFKNNKKGKKNRTNINRYQKHHHGADKNCDQNFNHDFYFYFIFFHLFLLVGG